MPRRSGLPGSKISNARHVWTSNSAGTFSMLRFPEMTDEEKEANARKEKPAIVPNEPGDTICLEIPDRQYYMVLNLTRLTEEELTYLGEVFRSALSAALPICQKRDAHAASRAGSHIDPNEPVFEREYRQAPTLYRRGNDSIISDASKAAGKKP